VTGKVRAGLNTNRLKLFKPPDQHILMRGNADADDGMNKYDRNEVTTRGAVNLNTETKPSMVE
jgi:hypothetical protein